MEIPQKGIIRIVDTSESKFSREFKRNSRSFGNLHVGIRFLTSSINRGGGSLFLYLLQGTCKVVKIVADGFERCVDKVFQTATKIASGQGRVAPNKA